MCNFTHSREAHRWQKRAEKLYKEGYGDCDTISVKVLEEMKAQGLVLGKDVVVMRGRVQNTPHMCLEMWGKNATYKRGKNIYHKINGYRIDGTAGRLSMLVTFKGPYGD